MAVFNIPLSNAQQAFSVTLAGVQYTMRVIYCDDPAAGWLLDIGDFGGNPIVCGIPLKPGVNLLSQYEYLFGSSVLAVTVAGDTISIGYADLGTNAQLYWVTP